MLNDQDIFVFLESKGFSLIEQVKDLSFGDRYIIFSNRNIEFKFITDRSSDFRFIMVKNSNESDWYDLALVKDMLSHIDMLNHPTTIGEYISFLKDNFNQVIHLFDTDNYPSTKEELNKLQHKRAKQMFPGLVK